MANEVMSYLDMCRREGASLQRGMNFRLHGDYSVILMCRRRGAPYRDFVDEDGRTLVYEGHDQPRSSSVLDPKSVDQVLETAKRAKTENGKFYEAAQTHKLHGTPPEKVRVYEKIRQGLWADNGVFLLVDAWREWDGKRFVFKFRLVPAEGEEPGSGEIAPHFTHSRLIPTSVKLEVWRRDAGRCVICGATDELHFDHVVPHSKGGTSVAVDNVQLLCARHNLEKSDRIQ